MSMHEQSVHFDLCKPKGVNIPPKAWFTAYVAKTLKNTSIVEPVELSLSIVDRKSITKINQKYREKDGPTDVISFALEDENNFLLPQRVKKRLLGDIYICSEVVAENAHKNGQTFEQELAFVFVHSLLHLLGYDHKSERERKKMDKMTNGILSST